LPAARYPLLGVKPTKATGMRLWPVIERMSLEVVALVKGFCR
jgi:hypothetical protein